LPVISVAEGQGVYGDRDGMTAVLVASKGEHVFARAGGFRFFRWSADHRCKALFLLGIKEKRFQPSA
jgi:hypothetical protein